MTTRPVPHGGRCSAGRRVRDGPRDLPLVPAHEIAGIVAEVTKHAVQTMLLDVLAATRDAGALLSGDPVRLGRCCARSHTARDRRPGLRRAARVRGQRPRDPHELMDDLFDYPRGAATLRHDQSRAATRTPANPTISAGSTSVMDESMSLAAATPAPAAERSPTGIGAEADPIRVRTPAPRAKALGEHVHGVIAAFLTRRRHVMEM